MLKDRFGGDLLNLLSRPFKFVYRILVFQVGTFIVKLHLGCIMALF